MRTKCSLELARWKALDEIYKICILLLFDFLRMFSPFTDQQFFARNSVAVDPAFAYCTNRCTRRKVTVNAHATNRENRKMKKTRRHEKFETTGNITARGTSSTLATLLVETR